MEAHISFKRFKVTKFPQFTQTLVIHVVHTHLFNITNMGFYVGNLADYQVEWLFRCFSEVGKGKQKEIKLAFGDGRSSSLTIKGI